MCFKYLLAAKLHLLTDLVAALGVRGWSYFFHSSASTISFFCFSLLVPDGLIYIPLPLDPQTDFVGLLYLYINFSYSP